MTLKTFLPVILLLLSNAVKAQAPVANFTASKISGCSPLVVSFKDSSLGDPKFWNWDFGNGQISNVQNPTVTYSRPGTYSVTLVVRNAGGTNGITKDALINVSSSPVASFTANRLNACVPSTINFSDNSTDGTGTISSWEWSFGDGNTSTEQNPSHNYAEPGFYTVSLKVTSSTGCSSTVSRVRMIRIFPGVVADFVPIAPASCNPPFAVTLNNQSSGPGVLTYSWDLGSGGTSTALNPTVTYNSSGNYTAKLTTTSDFGCSNTVEKTFPVQQFNSGFSGPDTICINSTASFTNTSTDIANAVSWQIGDSLYTGNSASRTFNVAGVYPVKMFQTFASCKDSVIKNLVVAAKPAIQFTADRQAGCKAPHSVTFNDQTPNAVSWFWEFGDGNTSSEKSPQHSYSAFGKYSVRLTVTDRFGCSDSLTKTDFITITAPEIKINNAPAGACAPFTFRPLTTITSNEPVTSYLWEFGTGATSSVANPSYTYNDSGTYDLSLRIITSGGCEDTLMIRSGVRVGKPPVVNFSVSEPDVCSSKEIAFTDLSTGGVNSWSWDFGDGTTSNEKNPTHTFRDTGLITVRLTAANNGCPVTITKPNILHIKPPVASFDYDVVCGNPGLVNFRNTSLIDPNKAVKYHWSFGDPLNTVDSNRNVSFKYRGVGNYNVILTVTQDTCSSSDTIAIEIADEPADFLADKTTACIGETIKLTATGSDASNIASYQWKIGNGAIFTSGRSIDVRIPTVGQHDVMLIVTDKNGCTDSIVKASFLQTTGPAASFTVSKIENCANAPVEFNDQSTSAIPIRTWRWNFGDSTIMDFNAPPFTHVYKDTGYFNITLTVIDNNGCSHTVGRPNAVHISQASANFGSDSTLLCPGLPVMFTDSSLGSNLTYLWDFGDGGTSTDQHPVHAFMGSDSTYSVSLKVTNSLGCTDSMTRQNFISVKSPKPGFETGDTLTLCPPFETIFLNTGTDYESIYWDMGDGSNILLGDTVRHFYNDYGTYTASQILVGFGGCRDTATRTIQVINPTNVKMDYNPLTACNRLTVDFNLQPPPGTKFNLVFGDGKLDSSQNTTLSHHYGSPAIYNPVMVITDPIGCIVNVGGPSPIRVIGAIPLFGVDNIEFCDTGTVYFTNYTIGNDPVISYRWDFGDGQTSTTPDEVHTYTRPGIYYPSLTVNTRSGCQDVVTDTIYVYGTPVTNIISKDTVCAGETVLFTGQLNGPAISNVTYNWSFGDGKTSTINNPANIFTTPGTYTVTLNTSVPFGCSSVTTKQIVVTENPSITFPELPVVIAGRSVVIPVSYTGDIINYKWTPRTSLTCDDCPYPSARPQFDTKYTLTVTDSRGCTDTKDITVNVVCTGSNVFLPSSFSPNRDGSNDIFYVRGTGLFSVKSFRIFNRWGQMVFEKMNFTPNQQTHGWNGTLNGKDLVSDVYVYAVEIVCRNGEVFLQKGDVMLLR